MKKKLFGARLAKGFYVVACRIQGFITPQTNYFYNGKISFLSPLAEFLLVPAALISLVINHSFDVMEILWTFSIYLESVAILPQLFMISKTGEAESITSHYLFALGAYRALYIFNWAYR